MPLALLASCSNDDIVNNGNQTSISGDGKYMSVSINLPTMPATRADNDNYDDGTANEYKIFSGCLVLFNGADEANATFGAAYDLQALNPVPSDPTDDNITETILKSVQLENFTYTDNDNLYAFVMLNYNTVAEVTNENNLTLKTKGEDYLLKKGETKFADAFYKITNSKFYEGEGTDAFNFFMCNSPLSLKIGGPNNNPSPASIHMLSLLDKSKIKDSKTEAEKDENCAGSIYVERAVAKAKLNWRPTEFSEGSTVGTLDKQKPTFTFIGWALDVTEPESFIARKVDGADWWGFTSSNLNPANYRFVGNQKVGETNDSQSLYRTYWCYDPHYDTDIYPSGNDTPQLTDESFKENTNPLYCYENTFDVAHMNYKNTTRAVFQVYVGFGEDATSPQTFYVLDGKEDEIYTSLKNVESYPRSTIIGSYIIETKLREALKAGESLSTDEIEEIVDITFSRDATTGIRSVTDITIKPQMDMETAIREKFEKNPTLSEDDKKILKSNANSYEITEYEGGKMYYEARFMHFGSPLAETGKPAPGDLTPWTTDKDNVTSTEEAYGNNATDYLGRWGMVRNNWYDLTVTAVRKLGSPVIPDANVEKSDDNNEKEQHIAFKINVLSWAKRTQNIEF